MFCGLAIRAFLLSALQIPICCTFARLQYASLLQPTELPCMPGHIDAHIAMRGHFSGVCLVRAGFSIYRIAQELVLIAEASTAEEWLDQFEWIPF
jgi:hypothetical protein